MTMTIVLYLLPVILCCVNSSAFTLLNGETPVDYRPVDPTYIPGFNSPFYWSLPGMVPNGPWRDFNHLDYHKNYEERVFPEMFWNYAWVNWMPQTEGFWAGKHKLQLKAVPYYRSYARPVILV